MFIDIIAGQLDDALFLGPFFLGNRPAQVYAHIHKPVNDHRGRFALRQQKIMFDSHPCLFVGGGSIQLMPYIIKNPLIKKETCLFIKDAKANAKGYARLIKAEMEG